MSHRLAEEKGARFWKAWGSQFKVMFGANRQGLERRSPDHVRDRCIPINGSNTRLTAWLSYLVKAHADLRQFDDAWRCIGEAIGTVERTKERWWDAEVNRIAGEVALQSTEPDAAKAETYFKRALDVARQQQAKSWELRAAMSLARLWRNQRKVQRARELLAPVYGWFTEGFDTRDLKEAKALLEELAS